MRMVGRTVITKDHCIVSILVVVMIVNENQGIIFNGEGFTDFQLMPCIKAQANSQVSLFRRNDLFDVTLGMSLNTLENRHLNSLQVFRERTMQHLSNCSPVYGVV